MTQAQIHQVLVIAKHMSISKASKELYLTQPALSYSLSKVEEELGIRIFYCDGNRLVISREGQKILEDMADLDAGFNKMVTGIRQMQKTAKNTAIRIGFSGSVMNFASMFVSGFLSDYKGTPIEKLYAEHSQIENMLLNGMIDFAITYPPLSGQDISNRLISRDEIVLALSLEHPLARKAKIYLQNLEQYEFTALSRANPFRRLCDALMEERHIQLKIKEFDYLEHSRKIETERYKSGLLTFTTRNSYPKWFGSGYIMRSVEEGKLFQETAVSWRTNSDIPYRHAELLDQIISRYREVYDNADNQHLVIRDYAQ